MTTITICSSANFYAEVLTLKAQLEGMGYAVLVPQTALKMEASGDFDPSGHKTWYGKPEDYDKKAKLMRDHFAEVAKGDATLVVNNEKHGTANYIGGNVLMEMAVAFYLNKPLYLLNDVPAESTFLEEILGLQAVPLRGDLQRLAAAMPAG